MSVRARLAAGVVALLLVSCGPQDRDVRPPADDATRVTIHADVVPVPDVVGVGRRDALQALRAVGLRPRSRPVADSACVGAGVLRQRPPAGAIVGHRTGVVLEVNEGGIGRCGLGLPRADDVLRNVAIWFIGFARRGAAHPSLLAGEVALHLGNRLIAVVGPTRLAELPGWRTCTPEGGYAGRTCPFSAPDLVRHWPGRLALTGEPASHSCAHPSDPLGWDGLGRVTITPDETLDCTAYWAVELYVDRDGLITAVNVILAEP